MDKSEVFVVMTLLKNSEGKFLAQVRNDPENPIKHNKWELTGGKVEFDETPEQAVVRETKEEAELDIEVVSMWPKVHIQYWDNEKKGVKYKCILISFECKLLSGELPNPPKDPKISEIRFISEEEIHTLEWGSQKDKDLLIEFSKK